MSGMDYRDYNGLLERYNEIDKVSFGAGDTEEDVIRRLMDISREKKRIQTECNAVIGEYIVKYEQAPERLDDKAEELLKDFLNVLMQTGQCVDTPIAFRISKLLLRYYQTRGDVDKTVFMLEYCTVFEIIIKEHLDDYEGSMYARLSEKYLDNFEELSERAKKSLINSWLLSVINRKDMTYGLRKYKDIKENLKISVGRRVRIL